MTTNKKQHLFTCEICQKGTNNTVWIWGRAKTALCSKDYKKWLAVKGKYYELAVVEFFGNLEKF